MNIWRSCAGSMDTRPSQATAHPCLKSWLAGQAEQARSNEDLVVDAERRIEARIAEHLTASIRVRLDALLTEMVDDRLTRFVWLRQFEAGGNFAAAVRLLKGHWYPGMKHRNRPPAAEKCAA